MSETEVRRIGETAWSLSSHLLALCLAILLPGMVLGSLALWSLFSAERTSTELRLIQAVDAIASGIDREVLAITRVGESLAASPLLQSGDLEAFELQARQLLGLQGWYVILTDRDGRQILNTTFPAGNPLPEGDGERIREVIETGKPQVTNLLYAAARMPLVGVRIPVISGGQTAYVLTVAVPAEIFTPFLDQTLGKLNWTVEIADLSGRIIARSHQHAEYVGKDLPPPMLEQAQAGTRIRWETNDTSGETVTVVALAPLTGWIVAATVLGDELAAMSRRGWTTFALLAVALTTLSIFLAYIFARRIAQPIHHLASIPLEGGEHRFSQTGLAEVNRVGVALVESIRQLEASKERYRTLVEAANDIIYTTDLDGRFLSCNAAGYKALGFTEGELIGRSISSLIRGDLPITYEKLSQNSENSGQERFEVELTAHSGQHLVWEISSRLLRDPKGKPETILSIARDVTERKRAEEAIRANEERLRMALAGVGAGVWEYDFTTSKWSWSPEMLELYGLSERCEPPSWEEMLNLVHPDDRENLRSRVQQQIERGGPFSAKFRVLRPDGQLVWISSKGVVELDANGRAIRARGIDQDVTAARTAEIQREQLLHTTAQQLNELQSLYNSAPIGLALLDREFRFQRINSVLAEMTGLPVEAHIGQLASDLIPEFRSAVEPLFRHTLETGESRTGIEFSTETPAKPGVQRTWIIQLYPLRSPGGAVVGVGMICDEVTDQRRAQLDEAHLAAIVESSTDAIISWSIDGRIRSWNPGAERMFGYTAAEAIGRDRKLLLPDNSDGESSATLFERVKAGERVATEGVRRRKDGREIPVSISASPMYDGFGRLIAVSVIFRDISEQKRREEHTRFIMRELSHRSKNLLAVIQAMARQTARTSRNLWDFQDRFTSRVRGLAQSHDLLVKRDWRGVPVSDLVRAHIAPFVDRSEQGLLLSGPTLSLNPSAAQNIGLALHELATNASKHGALTVDTGQIEIRWRLRERDGNRRFLMSWEEAGGPKVTVPNRRGFGHTVIEAMIGRTLEGEARIDWRKDGIVWRLDVPATSIASEDAPIDFLPEGMASELLAIYRKWLTLSSRSGSYPPPSAIDIDRSGEADRLFLVALEPAQNTAFFRYLYIGRALAQFGRPDKGEGLRSGGEEILGSLESYHDCIIVARQPCYDWARMRANGKRLEFERLLLPFAEDGKTITHILGAAVVNDDH